MTRVSSSSRTGIQSCTRWYPAPLLPAGRRTPSACPAGHLQAAPRGQAALCPPAPQQEPTLQPPVGLAPPPSLAHTFSLP